MVLNMAKTEKSVYRRIELNWIINFGILGLAISLLMSWYISDLLFLLLPVIGLFVIGVIFALFRSIPKAKNGGKRLDFSNCKNDSAILLKDMKLMRMLSLILDLISFALLIWLFILILLA